MGLIAAPSNGSSTMASTSSLMNVSTWLICRLTSLVPSAIWRSMSGYCSSRSRTLLVMAAIQPWSAAGAEKAMVTVSPSSSLLPAAAAGAASPSSSSAASWALPVHADRASAATAPATRPVTRRLRRVVVVRSRMMSCSLFSRWFRWCGVCGVRALAGGRTSREALLQHHGDDDDRALGDRLGGGVLVVEGEDIGERLEDQHTEDGADDGAPAPGEQRSSDDD